MKPAMEGVKLCSVADKMVAAVSRDGRLWTIGQNPGQTTQTETPTHLELPQPVIQVYKHVYSNPLMIVMTGVIVLVAKKCPLGMKKCS